MALALFLLEVDAANSLDRQRVFRDRLNPLEAYNNTEFISRYTLFFYKEHLYKELQAENWQKIKELLRNCPA